MKNKIIIFISLIIIISVMGLVVLSMKTDIPEATFTEDEIKFKEEYESLNGIEYKENQVLKSVNISNDNNIKYVSDDEIISLLEDGTNIIYFGWSECNWCRTMIPILIDVAKINNVETIYYYNFNNIRVAYENDNDKSKSELYKKIIDIIGEDIITVFDEESPKNGEKKLLAPTVVFIKNGVYIGSHTKTVDSHIKDTDDLSIDQKNELTKIYQNFIDQIMLEMCYQKGC